MKWSPLKRRLLLGQRSKSQPLDLPSVGHGQKFDEATGQVYIETIVSIPSGDHLNWTQQRCQTRERYEKDFVGYQEPLDGAQDPNVGSLKGARSLQDMAIETILGNIHRIDLEYLETLPSSILDRVWFEVNRRSVLPSNLFTLETFNSTCLSWRFVLIWPSGMMSFDLWRTFSKLLLHRGDITLRLLRHRQAIESPSSPLEIYTAPLTSTSFEFITNLSLTTAFPLPDLVKLSNISNLGVLEIVNTSGTAQRIVGDRLIRAWNIAALNDGAFKVLRILRLWNHMEVTSKSLVYLNSFPALGIYDVRGCGFDFRYPIHARDLGWSPVVDPNILGVLQADCVKRAVHLQSILGVDAKPIRRGTANQLWDGAKVWKVPRKELPAFLTREATSRPGTPRPNCQSFVDMHKMVDRLQYELPDLEIKKYRWETLDRHMFAESRMKQTWEFQMYNAFNRLGELRDDKDLRRAGIDTGDQAMVNNELINSVPVVSIRLGPTPPELRPSSPGNSSHKPFYNTSPNSSASSLTRLSNDWETPYTRLNSQSLCFTRYDLPEAPTSAFRIQKQDTKTEVQEQETALKRKRTGVAKNKKMKLGDVLGSFL